jgi:hypothetical protein
MENLGKLGRDKITGFEGIITAITTHLYGCNTYHLSPKSKDGKRENSEGFDEGRIEIIGKGVKASEVQSEKPGGETLTSPDNRVF